MVYLVGRNSPTLVGVKVQNSNIYEPRLKEWSKWKKFVFLLVPFVVVVWCCWLGFCTDHIPSKSVKWSGKFTWSQSGKFWKVTKDWNCFVSWYERPVIELKVKHATHKLDSKWPLINPTEKNILTEPSCPFPFNLHY